MKIINEDHIMETQLLSKGYQSQDLTFYNLKFDKKPSPPNIKCYKIYSFKSP